MYFEAEHERTIRIAVMSKRALGKNKVLTQTNWKERVFVLTPQKLSYHEGTAEVSILFPFHYSFYLINLIRSCWICPHRSTRLAHNSATCNKSQKLLPSVVGDKLLRRLKLSSRRNLFTFRICFMRMQTVTYSVIFKINFKAFHFEQCSAKSLSTSFLRF